MKNGEKSQDWTQLHGNCGRTVDAGKKENEGNTKRMDGLQGDSEVITFLYCRECGAQFVEWYELVNHQENAHNVFRCKTCYKEETSVEDFEYHLQQHGGFKLFMCMNCQDTFSSLYNLNNHLASHLAENAESVSSLSDKDCYETPIELRGEKAKIIEPESADEEVVEIIESPKPADEEDSNDSEDTDDNVNVAQVLKRSCSVLLEQVNTEKIFKCSECPYTCKYRSGLMQHMTIHSDERPFECDICGMTFGAKARIRSHMRTHTTNCLFCYKCGKILSMRDGFRKYCKIHDPVKNIVCDWESCNYSTHLRERLQSHRRIHTDEKSFACEFCGVKFRRNQHMKNHIASLHKPHSIPRKHCGKKFSTKEIVNNHILRNHPEKTISCPVCNKKYGLAEARKRHMIRFHHL
ncbi:oocyte zinc finger protein XlCOF6-like [Phlebotomus argentipes]|uniref:oocyte zinc finger protein XlCOF6-like n=1 Tax=Phlebotomus argentipes TaxID=94469 RepID=UPI0028937514|nr:oocyte zinc finger protein XlCOF6-like [Phlebotomus argentipes]